MPTDPLTDAARALLDRTGLMLLAIREAPWSGSIVGEDAYEFIVDLSVALRAALAAASPEDDQPTPEERDAIYAMQMRTDAWQNADGEAAASPPAPADDDTPDLWLVEDASGTPGYHSISDGTFHVLAPTSIAGMVAGLLNGDPGAGDA